MDDETETRAQAYGAAIRWMRLTRKEFWRLPQLNEMPDQDIVMGLVRAGIHIKSANNMVVNYRGRGSRKTKASPQ